MIQNTTHNQQTRIQTPVTPSTKEKRKKYTNNTNK